MIVTDLSHIDHQLVMTPALRKAIDFLRFSDTKKLPEGRCDIDGERVFALVQCYETGKADAPKFEHHRKYIDVQFIVSGREVIGWAPAERMHITRAYDADRDICFGTIETGTWTPVHLQAEQLAILWPEDGHAPKLAAGAPSPVMKIVVKVAV